MIQRFRRDNTEGYSATDLVALNTAWEEITGASFDEYESDHAILSMLDHWSEQLLAEYDAGKRGNNLTLWFYEGH